MQNPNKIVLAYSGGLDTSYCIPYLVDLCYEVHAVNINTGSFTTSEIEEMGRRAENLGAKCFSSINIESEYYSKCIKYLVFGNVLRNNNYPLSVSSERPFQALSILGYCLEHSINAVAHGSTGAGNDQIRFDLIFRSLAPQIEIITPIRDQGLSRAEEVTFLHSRGFDWTTAKKDYSVNKGLWGTSIGGKETLTSDESLPEMAYPSELTLKNPSAVELKFDKGEIITIDGLEKTPTALIKALEKLASPYAIGRDTHVGDTIIGIKGRVGFEAAAPLIIIKSHELLEKHTLGKWQIYWKAQLAQWYGMMLHEGHYLDPVMRNIETFLEESQTNVSGVVKVRLRPYGFDLLGVETHNDLMNAEFGSYGEKNLAWSGADARGFIEILSNANKVYYHTHKEEIPC